jgi:asparagine synthase (glutamine-hydrolysing)
MLKRMRHRGPDEGGLWGEGIGFVPCPDDFSPPHLPTGSRVWLGNRRLRILDLSPTGRQPMSNEDGTIWVAFNGEIVNFLSLRQTLHAKGHRFRSRTDTEVLVHAYEEWGERFVERLRGMFALAIWDGRNGGRLLLARDPLGIKPLYLWVDRQTPTSGEKLDGTARQLLFASEVRALLASGWIAPRLSKAGLWTYLCFGSVQEPFTLVEGITALPPGTVLTVTFAPDGLQITHRRYFHLPSSAEGKEQVADKSTALRALRELLTETMGEWLLSDVPLGIFLSGGIDSASVLSLARKALGEKAPLRTFTIAFREEAFNEAPLARQTAQQFGAEHTEVLVTPDEVLTRLPDALKAMDQPTMDGINTYFVSEAAKKAGLTVALSGLGGDEVFAGYSTFQSVPRLWQWQRWRSAPLLGRCLEALAPLLPIPPDAKAKLRSLLRGESFLPDGALSPCLPYLFARALFPPETVEELLAVGDGLNLAAWHERVAEVWAETEGLEALGKVSVLELRHYLLNTLLRDTDSMSMAHSLEVRPPLLDVAIVRTVLPLPDDWKRDGRTPKALLVAAVGDLPSSLVFRRKATFTFPWAIWLRGPLRPVTQQALMDLPDLIGDFRPEGVRAIWQNFWDGKTSWSRVWALAVLSHWLRANEMKRG